MQPLSLTFKSSTSQPIRGKVFTQPIQQPQSSLRDLSLHCKPLKSLHTRPTRPQEAQSCETRVCRSMRMTSSLRLAPHRHQQRARTRL